MDFFIPASFFNMKLLVYGISSFSQYDWLGHLPSPSLLAESVRVQKCRLQKCRVHTAIFARHRLTGWMAFLVNCRPRGVERRDEDSLCPASLVISLTSPC